MKKYLCVACATNMDRWLTVEADEAPADDEHQHGWREATSEEDAKAETVKLEDHETMHEEMMKKM